jgi:hypothetical protein
MNEGLRQFIGASIVMLAMILSVYLSYTIFGGY